MTTARLQPAVNLEENTGGVVLRYTAERTARLRLREKGGCELAAWSLPAAAQPRELLLPLSVARPCEAVFVAEEGISLLNWRFHTAQEVVVGENPLTLMDFPDVDIIRVGDTYYMISTTMYFMPGGVILRSYDLIHWEYCTRIYDILEDTPAQRLDGDNAYGAGMWAATLRWHKGTFYVVFVANDTKKTYLYRAESIMGPWRRSCIAGFYHDCSLLFDDDDRVYLVYGQRQIRLVELDAELTGPREGGLRRILADSGESRYLGYEGTHIYKINGKYYLFMIHSRKDRWRRVETCLCSDSLTGEFRGGVVMDDDMGRTDAGVAQGGIIDTPDGRWFAILFQDVGAVGRIPVLMPMAWEGDWPVLGLDGRIPQQICNLTTRPGHTCRPLWDSDDFSAHPLKEVWEWNHIPDLSLVRHGDGQLRIRTGKTEPVFTQVQNMLTQRTLYPGCTAQVTVDATGLQDGDAAGLCALQLYWAWIGLQRQNGACRLVLRSRTEGDGEAGMVRVSLPWENSAVRLKAEMRFSPEKDLVQFFYLTEAGWQPLGEAHELFFRLEHFTGNRFGLFVQSFVQPGGEAAFTDFVMEATRG